MNVAQKPGPAPSAQGQQIEMPFALVQGEPLTQLPNDLHIPPHALEVFLEEFSGPLDLLLYLIRRQNIDILNIPIAEITRQYVLFIDLMEELQLELASEYLVMASILAEIKSRMLLPREPDGEETEEADPRAELVRRLQEYERFRQAADTLDTLPRCDRDIFAASVQMLEPDQKRPLPQVSMDSLLTALVGVLRRADQYARQHIEREPLSVRERMTLILDVIQQNRFIPFTRLFNVKEKRAGIVVTLLAILELSRESLLEMVQNETGGCIYLSRASD